MTISHILIYIYMIESTRHADNLIVSTFGQKSDKIE